MYAAKILLDSISETGKRLTTFEITFPRIILSEFNTHRMLSRNSASSRAIPFKKQLQRVLDDPFIPERFPINGKGMQPQSYYEKGSYEYGLAGQAWLDARDSAIKYAKTLTGELPIAYQRQAGDRDDFRSDTPIYVSVHKQIANRLLEPFMWHTVICTATELDNFFKLRTHPDAQYEIKRIADLMYDAYHYGTCPDGIEGCEVLHTPKPQLLKRGEWHMPLISQEDHAYIDSNYYKLFSEPISNRHLSSAEWEREFQPKKLELLKKVSVARCARISYLTHDGIRDMLKDLELFERLRTSGHWSCFEHVARPYFDTTQNPEKDLPSGNFIGWKALRKEFKEENCTYFRK
jgi:hypothetical protein